MGLDDRDSMRERYRDRARGTRWNDRTGRVEGAWFDAANAGHDYRCGRFAARGRSRFQIGWLPFALSLLLTVIPAYYALEREGWLPDLRPGLPFPASGSVTVDRRIDPKSATARLAVVTANANAVVQLFDAETGRHVISVYVRKNDRATVAVPPGDYRMKIAEGQRWHGPRDFFGTSTTYETVAQVMSFRTSAGNGVNLNRRINGNLPTRPNWTGPDPL